MVNIGDYIYHRYLKRGYTVFESRTLHLLEQRGIGYYKYRKEIEYALQTVLQNYRNGNIGKEFDINSIQGCNITFAESVIISVDTDFTGNHGEYSIEHKVEQDKDGNLVIPEADNDPNYDNSTQKIREAKIHIHLEVSPDGTINESKYRQTIAYELNHLRDDYEIRKATNNEWSLLKEFVMGNVDVGLVMSNVDNPITNIIYRLFIDTEWHALGSQMYEDMYNLYKERGCRLDRRNASNDINDTESMREYNVVKVHFNTIIKRNPMFGNFAIRYFPKWYEQYAGSKDRDEKERVIKKFSKWFIRLGEGRMKKVFSRIIKAASLLYDDIEDSSQFTFESYYRKGKMITEMMGDERQPEDETAVVFMVTESGDDIIPYTVRYNKLYVEDWFTPDEPSSDWIL